MNRENRFTAEEYRDWVRPSDKLVLDYANSISDMNAIHFCAWEEIPNRLSIWEDYKAPVISWSKYFDIMDIQEAKKHFGSTVWGGFDNRPGTLLYTGTKEEIEKETEKLLAQGGKQGFILGSDCSMSDSIHGTFYFHIFRSHIPAHFDRYPQDSVLPVFSQEHPSL